jgi:hypothetical protein
VELVFTSRGNALGSSTSSLATLAGTIDETLDVDFGKLSQGE